MVRQQVGHHARTLSDLESGTLKPTALEASLLTGIIPFKHHVAMIELIARKTCASGENGRREKLPTAAQVHYTVCGRSSEVCIVGDATHKSQQHVIHTRSGK